MQKDRACDVYTGSVAATKTQLTLRATVASAVLRLFVIGLFLAFFSGAVNAQTTNINLSVTDTAGQSWNNGTWKVDLVSPPGVVPFGPPFFLINTSTPVPNQHQSGSLSGSGTASMTLTQNSGIAPSLSKWLFTVCSQATSQVGCYTQFVTVTSTTTLNLTPPPIVVQASDNARAYQDSEVLAGTGLMYYNLTLQVVRVCNTDTNGICTSWSTVGAGAIAATLPNTSVAFSATPSFNATSSASYTMTLTGNVTAITIAGVPINGNLLRLAFTQDATGGRTVVWPGNFIFPLDFALRVQPLSENDLFFHYDGTNWHFVENIPDGALDYSTVSFSATPTFSNSRSAAFDFTLTGNVTSSTFTTTGRAGTQFVLNACQDATGGRTFAFPGNVSNPQGFVLDLAPNHCNRIYYYWNNTQWIGIGTSGGGGIPAAPFNCIQKNSSGVFGCSNLSEVGTKLVVGDDPQFGGPNPYLDGRAFGMRGKDPTIAPQTPGITANCTSGSPSVTLSNASDFRNGDGVVVYGCGPGTIAAPAAPTVTPSVLIAQTGLLLDANGPVGATTYCYQLVARSLMGATNVSPETCTTTGPASLGLQTNTITSVTLGNNGATYTTSAPHGLVPGAFVVIGGVGINASASIPNPFNGWFTVGGVPDNTHFTVGLLSDTRNGAITAGTGGTVSYWNSIHIKATETTNNYIYYVYGRSTGGSKTLIGAMWPQDVNLFGRLTDPTYLVFDDLGSPVTTFPNPPYYIPTAVPTQPTNDMFVSTILSGGGTTSLTLANNAGHTNTSQTILFDDAITFVNAAIAAVPSGAPLMVPDDINTTSGYYVFNSPITIGQGTSTNGLTVFIKAPLWLNEPIVTANVPWYGQPGSQDSFPSFANNITAFITISRASPGFFATNNNYFYDMAWELRNANGQLGYIQENGGIPSAGGFRNVSFVLSTLTNYSNMAAVFRGGGAGWDFTNTLLSASQNNSLVATTPGMYWDLAANVSFKNLTLSGVGCCAFRVNPAGGFVIADNVYSQGGYMPYFSLVRHPSDFAAGFYMEIRNTIFDTTQVPLVANYGGHNITLHAVHATPGGQTFTGSQISNTGPNLLLEGSVPVPSNSGVDTLNDTYSMNDGILGRIFGSADVFNKNVALGPANSVFTLTGPNAPPTCPVSAGGSVPIGDIYYYYNPIHPNGSEGTASTLCKATTTTGNQTVTITMPAIQGVSLYNIYRSVGLPGNVGGLNCTPTGPVFVDIAAATCGFSGTNLPAGGPAGMRGDLAWANRFQGGGYTSFPTSTKTSAYTPTVFDNIIPVNASSGGFTVSLNPALIGSHWVILRYDNVPGNVLTIAPTSGAIDGSASTTLSALSGMIVTCDGVNCHIEGRSSGGGAANINNAVQFSFPYYSAAGLANTLSGLAPPTTNSTWKIVYQVVGGVAVAPTVALDGIPVIQLTGSAVLDYTYRAAHVIFSSCTTPTFTLPAIGGTTASNLPFTITNNCSGNLTITSTTPNSINGGLVGNSVTLFPGQFARFTQDNTPNWWATFYVTTNGVPTNCTAITNSATLGLICATLPVVSNVNSQTVTYTAVAVDNGKIVSMNGSSITLNLPASPPAQPWGIFVQNLNASSLTVSRNGLNIDGAASNITVPQNQGFWVTTDGSNYFTSRGLSSATAGVSSFTGDGALLANSGSTGAVTAVLGNAAAHTVWSRVAGTTGAPAYNTLGTADIPAQALTKLCDIPVGDTSGSAITNAQLGPQKRICQIPKAATVVQITVSADAGTPNVIVGRSRCTTFTTGVCTAETRVNLTSAALAAATGGFDGCSNTGGTTGIDGGTTCSATLQNTGLNAGDYLELVSGTAGGTAKLMTIHIYGTFN